MFSTKPAANHLRRIALSIGTLATSHVWLRRSKQDLMSASKTTRGEHFFVKTQKHYPSASAVERYGRSPYELGSARTSATGLRASRKRACIARSPIVGILNGLNLPFFFGM